MRDYLYVGMAGHICKIDPQNGKEVWRTKIGKNYPVQFIHHNKQIIATVMGVVTSVDAKTGTILWQNELKKLGYSVSSMVIGDKNLYTQVSNSGM
ncbi:MAG: PQQ-binding-like beta-propeller repeat protein [Bacteroidota bacterium]